MKKDPQRALPARHESYPYAVSLMTLLQISTLIATTQILPGRPYNFLTWGLCTLLYAALAPAVAGLCYNRGGSIRLSKTAGFAAAAITAVQGLIYFSLLTNLMLNAVFKRTPAWALALSAALAVLSVLYHGDVALKRMSRKIMPLCIVMLLLIYVFQVEKRRALETLAALLNPANFPHGTQGLGDFLTILLLCFCRPLLLTPILFPEMDKASFIAAQRKTALICGPLMMLQILMPVLTLGLPLFRTTSYPYYDAITLLVHGTPVVHRDTLAGFSLVLCALMDLGATALVVKWAIFQKPPPTKSDAKQVSAD